MKRAYPHPELRMDQTEFNMIAVPAARTARVAVSAHVYCYAIRRGDGELAVEDCEVRRIGLSEGDAVVTSGLVPHGFSAGADGLDVLQARVPAEAIAFLPTVGGVVALRRGIDEPILSHLWRAIDAVLEEYSEDPPLPWRADIVRRLSEVMAINVSRALARQSWFLPGAMIDERVFRAIAIASRDLERAWTVADLASEAGMSRTAFATRYREMLGDTPLRGLARMRLRQAALLLQDGIESVDVIALRVGYATATPFIRAFRREFGATPARWRRTRSNGDVPEMTRLQDARDDDCR